MYHESSIFKSVKFKAHVKLPSNLFRSNSIAKLEYRPVDKFNYWLLTETYSKDIDQYLNPTSCHPGHIFKAFPKALGIRLRKNCSERFDEDSKFIENLGGI